MIRGLGRCVIELTSHDNIEKYRDVVLWGCLHNIAYDAQSEGTRAEYLYVLQSKFRDCYFEQSVIDAFQKPTSNSWLFDQHCELLYLFAQDGSLAAKQALNAKFEYLLRQLIDVPSRKSYRPDREQFEWLCIWLTSLNGFSGFKQIVDKIGKSLVGTKRAFEPDLEWFVENSISKFGKRRIEQYLEKQSTASEAGRMFRDLILTDQNRPSAPDHGATPEISVSEYIEKSCEVDFPNYVFARKISRKATDDELSKLAEYAIREKDLAIKVNLLSVFRYVKYPADIAQIIAYANSSFESLRDIAMEILEMNPSPAVHEYAIMSAKTAKSDPSEVIGLLCANYSNSDRALLLQTLMNIPVAYESNWHGAYLSVLELCERNRRAPDDLLYFMYEQTLCSYCRNSIVRCMAKRKILSGELLSECIYDSYDETRLFAAKLLARRSVK